MNVLSDAQKVTNVGSLLSLVKNFKHIHRTYSSEIRRLYVQYNYSPLVLFTAILAAISGLELLFQEAPLSPSHYLFSFMLGFGLLMTGLLFAVHRNTGIMPLKWIKGLINVSLLIFLVWGILLVQIPHGGFFNEPVALIILIMSIAAVFILHPLYFFIHVVVAALLLFSPVYSLYAADLDVSFAQLLVCFGAVLISWAISIMRYLTTVEIFVVRDEMRRNESMAEFALASGNLGYWSWDIEAEKIYADKRWFSILGYSKEGKVISFADYFSMVMPGDRKELANKLQSYLEGRDETYMHHFRMQTKDGHWRWIYARGQITDRDEKGKPLRMHGVHQDIQEIQDRQKQLSESEARFKAYTENSPVGIFIVKDFRFIYVNPEATRITGYAPKELKRLKFLRLVHPDDQHNLINEVRKIVGQHMLSGEYTYRMVSKSGEVHWVEARVSLLEKADPVYLLSVIDITARKDAENKLKEYATLDELTGVFNRRVGISMLEQEMHHIERERSRFTICFVDINGLKDVNDTWGHDEGDLLIKRVVEIIQNKLRRGDMLCRLGGDEFLMMFKNCNEENAERIWGRIEKRLEVINRLSNKAYKISVSYGLLECSYGMNATVSEIIHMADQKMYIHKKAKYTEKSQKNTPARHP